MKHILFTVKGCKFEDLNDEEFILNMLNEASKYANSTLIYSHSHKFSPYGVTAFSLLAESHISIHTWPEKGMAVCDVFTCGNHTTPKNAVKYIKSKLNCFDIIVNEFERSLE